MCAHRLWPAVHTIGRGLINNRSEIFQQGVRAYNLQNFNNGHFGGQGHQHQNAVCNNYDNLSWKHHCPQSTKGIFSEVVSCPFQTGSACENEHAHAILRSLPAYSATTVGKDIPNSVYDQYPNYLSNVNFENLENCSAEEVADAFVSMSQMCHHHPMDLEDLQHSKLCGELSRRVTELNDKQLLKVLSSLTLWPQTSGVSAPNFVGLWNSLDHLCTKRLERWDISQMFLVADYWFALKLSKISMYNIQMTKILGKKITSMEPTQLVQYLFYVNLSRKQMESISLTELEKRLLEVIKHVSIEELGVIAMGFFKTETFFKNHNLVKAIISKTVENLDSVSNPTLSAILKVLRKSIPGPCWKSLSSLLNSLEPHLGRLHNLCLLQIALLGTNLLVFHEKLIDSIAARFSEDINILRLKDLERFALVLMVYNYTPLSSPNICAEIVEELKKPERMQEIHTFPKCFVSCVLYLANMGIYTPELISAALQPSNLELIQQSNNVYCDFWREVNHLDWYIEIEGPAGYPGYRLDPQNRKQLTKKYLGRIPRQEDRALTQHERMLLNIQRKLAALLGGDQYVTISNILPHMKNPDLVFCTSSDGEPVEIPDEYLEYPSVALKRPCISLQKLHWNAVLIGGHNAFIRNSSTLQGYCQLKKRQLNHLGYHVSVVNYLEYNHRSFHGKLTYLERILKGGSTFNAEGHVDRAYIALNGLSLLQKRVNLKL